MAEQPFDPAAVLAALHDADVRFVLIGGMAAILHGDVGVTVDIDIAPANDSPPSGRQSNWSPHTNAHPRLPVRAVPFDGCV